MSLYLCPRWRNKIDLFIYLFNFSENLKYRTIEMNKLLSGKIIGIINNY